MTINFRGIAIAALISVALYASGLLSIVSPLPVMVMTGRENIKSGLSVAVLSGTAVFLIGIFLSYFFAFQFLFFMALGLIWSLGMSRGWALFKTGFVTVLFSFAVAAVGLYFFHAEVQSVVTEVINKMFELNQKNELLPIKENVIHFIVNYFPSLVAVSSAVCFALNLGFVGRFVKGVKRSACVSLNSFKLPEGLIWFLISSGALFFLNEHFFKISALKWVAVNGMMISACAYFFQGMAIALFYLNIWKNRFIKWFFWANLFLFGHILFLVLVGLGVADVWLGFRERMKRIQSFRKEIL